MEKFNSKTLKSALDKTVAETSYTLKGNSENAKREVIPATLHHPYGKLKEQFVPFAEAYALKQLGFDEECFGAWIRNTELPNMGYYADQPMADLGDGHLAPLWQQAFKFFLDKFELSNYRREHYTKESGRMSYWYSIKFLKTEEKIKGVSMVYDTFEEARLECLRRLIDIAKNGNKNLFCSKV